MAVTVCRVLLADPVTAVLRPAPVPDNQWRHDLVEPLIGFLELNGPGEKRTQRTGHALQCLSPCVAGFRAQPGPLPFDFLSAGIFLGGQLAGCRRES